MAKAWVKRNLLSFVVHLMNEWVQGFDVQPS
jgi:hypothetical protein